MYLIGVTQEDNSIHLSNDDGDLIKIRFKRLSFLIDVTDYMFYLAKISYNVSRQSNTKLQVRRVNRVSYFISIPFF